MLNRNTYSSQHFDKSTAQKFRDRLAEVLEEPDKVKIELDLLNDLLKERAVQYRRSLQESLTVLFNQVSPRSSRPRRFDFGDDPEIKEENRDIITRLTQGDITTDLGSKIAINPRHTSYSAGDIRELEGYKELHNIAQQADVAITVRGLTAGEKDPPAVLFDALKSYAEGESDSKYGYPDLSPPPVVETSAADKAAFSTLPARRYTM
jgi:hypothetical protein